MPRGGDRKSDQSANLPFDSVSTSQAADILNVSERSGKSVRKVQGEAPQVAAAVDAGHLSVSLAAKVAALPEAAQADVVAAPKAQARSGTAFAMGSPQRKSAHACIMARRRSNMSER